MVTLDNTLQSTQGLAVDQTEFESFTVTSLDGTAVQTITVTVKGSNDAPTGAASAVLDLGTEDTPYIVTAEALLQGFSDVDGGSLTVVGLTANHGTVVANGDGTFTIIPDPNYHGPVTLSYSVSDGNGGSIAANQTFALTAVADLSAQDDAFSGDEDTAIGGSVAANDSTTSGGSLSYAVASGPANGTLVLNADGTFTYTPAANYHGADSFSYTVTDAAAGESDTRTVSLTVNSINDAAVISGQVSGAIFEDAAQISIGGDANSTDVDGVNDAWIAAGGQHNLRDLER